MGFFRRALRKAGFVPPESFAPPSFPFQGEVRLRHWEYDRLSTGWWQVTVNSPEEWEAKVGEILTGFRRHFGIFMMKDGRAVPRWNDRTWAVVQRGLVVEGR